MQGRYAGYVTDDFIVFAAEPHGGRSAKLLVQVKHAVNITENDGTFEKVIAAAWSDFQNPQSFDGANDGIALITGPLHGTDTDHARPILEWARASTSAFDFMQKVNADGYGAEKCAKVQAFRGQLDKANKGIAISDTQLWQFLKVFHLLGFDLDIRAGMMHALIHAQLGRFGASTALWDMIVSEVTSSNQSAGSFTFDTISQELKAAFAASVGESVYPFVRVHDAARLFGADDALDAFSPSRREYRENRVHCPALFDQVARALAAQRFACVLGKGASGKTTLALLLAYSAQFGPLRTFYVDLADADDARTDPEKYRALLMGIANQYGREALVVVDNVHLSEALALGVYSAWRDAGKPVCLLFQGRLTEKGPDHRGRQSAFADIRADALTLAVQAADLVGVVTRLLARRGQGAPPQVPDAVLRAWQAFFEGDLIAFSFAVRRKLSKFLVGNFSLAAADASDYVRAEYLYHPAHPISDAERENLLTLAACAEAEVSVPSTGLPFPGQLRIALAHGLVWNSLHGRDGQFQRCRLHHPGMGKLLWQAADPAKGLIDYQCESASREPYNGINLAQKVEQLQADQHAARRILVAAIARPDAFARLIENGLAYLRIQCRELNRLAIFTHAELDRRIAACENLGMAALATPLGDLRNFLEYAQDKLPTVFDAIVAGFASHHAELTRAALATPLGDLRSFLEYAQDKLPTVFKAIIADFAIHHAELTRAALATSLDHLRNFLEYAQEKLPTVYVQMNTVLTAEENLPILVTRALSTDFGHLAGFIRAGGAVSTVIINAVNAGLEARFRSKGTADPRLQAVRKNLELLTAMEVILVGCGCIDLLEMLVSQLMRDDMLHVWRANKNALRSISTVLRLARGAPNKDVGRFLRQIINAAWLADRYNKRPPQEIAITLYDVWGWSPDWHLFRDESLKQRAKQLVWNLHDIAETEKMTNVLELLGACGLFGLSVIPAKTVWPTQGQLATLFTAVNNKFGDQYLGAHSILFLLGLRVMVRHRRDIVTIPTDIGERMLALLLATTHPNANYQALFLWMITWLKRCKDKNWQLQRDSLPFPVPVYNCLDTQTHRASE